MVQWTYISLIHKKEKNEYFKKEIKATMETKHSKVELLALVKKHNKTSEHKIQNVDKMKKQELHDVCVIHSLILTEDKGNKIMNLNNISKQILMQNVEIHFLKKKAQVPREVMNMKKKELIDYITLNDIVYYTSEMIEDEIKEIEKEKEQNDEEEYYKNVIIYNIIRYDNIDIEKITKSKEYVHDNNLNTNLENYQEYAKMLNEIYTSYEMFCKSTGKEYVKDELKTFPKILTKIRNVIE